jgi:hypothetical protein
VEEAPVQTVALPLMAPGAKGGAPADTGRLAAEDVPQPFDAATVSVPLVEPAVAVMDAVVEVPDHPPGNVQL